MAAKSYFPSIHDKTERQEAWAFFNPDLRRVRTLRTNSRRESGSGTGGFVDQRCSTAQLVVPSAVCKPPNLLKGPEYRPLEVSGAAGEDRGSAPSSEADEICELCIKLKKFELCEMMEEPPKIHQSKFQRAFRLCRMKPRRQKIEKKHQKTTV